MPIFYFVSGYLYSIPSSVNTYITRKLKSLLVPFFVWAFIYYIIWCVFNGGLSFGPLISIFIYNTHGIPIAGALWFLVSLFCVDLMYLFVDSMVKNTILKLIVVILLSLFGTFFKQITGILLPFTIGSSLVGIGFFYFGTVVRNNQKINKIISYVENKILIMCLFSVMVIVSIMLNGKVNIRTEEYSFAVLFWINALVSIIIILIISKKIEEKMGNWIPIKILKKIGFNSIYFLCLNQFIIQLYFEICAKINQSIHIPKIVVRCSCLLFTVFSIYLISFMIEKIKGVIYLHKKQEERK